MTRGLKWVEGLESCSLPLRAMCESALYAFGVLILLCETCQNAFWFISQGRVCIADISVMNIVIVSTIVLLQKRMLIVGVMVSKEKKMVMMMMLTITCIKALVRHGILTLAVSNLGA